MTDRRPHWDDDLLDTVNRQLYKPMPVDQPVLRLYAVIAAVEDWTQEKRYPRLLKWWSEQYEAIQRARELHASEPQQAGVIGGHPSCTGCGYIWPCPTIRALDGDSDE